MKAVVRHTYGSPDVLELEEVVTPTPHDDEVLVKVYASSVNAIDWHMLRADPFLARLDSTWLRDVRLTWDAFNHDWRRNVVGFNYDRQRSLWRDMKLDRFAAWQIVVGLAAVLFLWGVLVVGWLMWKRRRQERALVLWDDLNRRLARAGTGGCGRVHPAT